MVIQGSNVLVVDVTLVVVQLLVGLLLSVNNDNQTFRHLTSKRTFHLQTQHSTANLQRKASLTNVAVSHLSATVCITFCGTSLSLPGSWTQNSYTQVVRGDLSACTFLYL